MRKLVEQGHQLVIERTDKRKVGGRRLELVLPGFQSVQQLLHMDRELVSAHGFSMNEIVVARPFPLALSVLDLSPAPLPIRSRDRRRGVSTYILAL